MNCVRHLKDALEEDINGVKVIDISLDNKYAIIDTDENVTDDMLKDVIADLGYELKGIE
ncbi:putative copper chaperone CopZ [[Clostridium] sordellii ATCC 9714]|nr:putative copper chaperone CopZ [[Clostridium] sordellii ATCC 9714] [Paeniclostridium sordellii ATCC 9714]